MREMKRFKVVHKFTHINHFNNRQEHSGSRLKRWEYVLTVVSPLDCRFQPFRGSTSSTAYEGLGRGSEG